MERYMGKCASGGIAIGRIFLYKKDARQVSREKITDAEQEKARYRRATEIAADQLGGLYEKARLEMGEESAAVLEVHQMMLRDDDYMESVENIIDTELVNGEYAVWMTGENFAAMFSAMDDEYMQARAADVKDISRRLIGVLQGGTTGTELPEEPVILLAEDLAPSETVQMDKEKVLSFVTVEGSTNSHTAILARTMDIPALVATDMPLSRELNGKMAIVDGDNGVLYVEPDGQTMEKMRRALEEMRGRKELLRTLKGKETITLDGQKVKLYANIGNLDDLKLALENDAGGIGLFRSEFLYLEGSDFPTEQAQFEIYKQAVQAMGEKPVIIRTLDIGADKTCDYFHMEKEENPAMGCRAIRICLTRPEIFKTQLRALLRASAYGNLAIMYPMITSLWEVEKIQEIVGEVKAELEEQAIPFGGPPQGVMIETPAAVMISRALAEKVDFFSIGTNDLTQYTLAVDRQNPRLDRFYDSHHPAVLEMIRMVTENAHRAGIWAGICGELGADTSLTQTFLEMGVDELSVAPGSILPIRKIILETDVEALRRGKAQ